MTMEELCMWLGIDGSAQEVLTWDECTDGRIMARCLSAMERWPRGDDPATRALAADCAEMVLHVHERARPDVLWPRLAIEATRAYAAGGTRALRRDMYWSVPFAWSGWDLDHGSYAAAAARHTAHDSPFWAVVDVLNDAARAVPAADVADLVSRQADSIRSVYTWPMVQDLLRVKRGLA